MTWSAKTIVLGFAATLLLLLAHALWADFFTYVWLAAVLVVMYGGWVWLVVSVSGELFHGRRWRLSQFLFPAILLVMVGLTWWFGIFPYAWNALVTLLLAGCVAWRGFRDYAELFRRRSKEVGPSNWRALELGRLPPSSTAAKQHAKAHFSRSYDVHITCRPRAGPMGLISQPLRMDE